MNRKFKTISTLLLLTGGVMSLSIGAVANESGWVSSRNEAKGLSDLARALSDRERALDLRERTIASAAADLATAEARLDEKIAKLSALDARVMTGLNGLDEAQEERVVGLVKMMERMRPRESAKLMTELEITLSVTVLNRMNRTKAGKMLAQMSPAVAAVRVEMMTQPIPLGVL
jgi:flagellar motility protein MotE (MotC chaperone)